MSLFDLKIKQNKIFDKIPKQSKSRELTSAKFKTLHIFKKFIPEILRRSQTWVNDNIKDCESDSINKKQTKV